MRVLKIAVVVATCLLCSSVALAQDAHDPHTATTDAHAGSDPGLPVVPGDASWAGVMVIVVLVGFFLPAAVIGPIARALVPEEEEPDAHTHDDHGAHDAHGSHDAHGHHH